MEWNWVKLFSFCVLVYIKDENPFFSPLSPTCFTNLCIHGISILVCPPSGLCERIVWILFWVKTIYSTNFQQNLVQHWKVFPRAFRLHCISIEIGHQYPTLIILKFFIFCIVDYHEQVIIMVALAEWWSKPSSSIWPLHANHESIETWFVRNEICKRPWVLGQSQKFLIAQGQLPNSIPM